MRRALVLFLVGLMWTAGAQAQASGAGVLERLRGLAGEWEGTYKWSSGRGGGSLKATYRVGSNGSTVIEDLIQEGVPSMTSVYHLDGPELRMTHYCAAGNQPRLKATHIEGDVVRFSFVDGTNLVERPAHVNAVELRFLPADRMVIEFTFLSKGKSDVEHIELKRVGVPATKKD